jgi:ubiquinone/menaquinone biosynthesis C-methylase UbiE
MDTNIDYSSYKGPSENNAVGLWSKLEHLLIEKLGGGRTGECSGTVLEIGGGAANHVKFVDQEFKHYFILDIFADKLQASDKRISFILGSAERIPLKKDCVDRVVITCVLAHLSDPIFALNEALRVLKVGGTLTILISNDPGFLYTIAWNLFARRSRQKWAKQDPKLGHALSHLVSGKSLDIVIASLRETYEVKKIGIPFYIPSYNFNLSTIFRIKSK